MALRLKTVGVINHRGTQSGVYLARFIGWPFISLYDTFFTSTRRVRIGISTRPTVYLPRVTAYNCHYNFRSFRRWRKFTPSYGSSIIFRLSFFPIILRVPEKYFINPNKGKVK